MFLEQLFCVLVLRRVLMMMSVQLVFIESLAVDEVSEDEEDEGSHQSKRL